MHVSDSLNPVTEALEWMSWPSRPSMRGTDGPQMSTSSSPTYTTVMSAPQSGVV